MVKNHRMIEPFQESQVKSNGNGKLYLMALLVMDMMFAAQTSLKFSKINSSMVDPKNFDDRVLSI